MSDNLKNKLEKDKILDKANKLLSPKDYKNTKITRIEVEETAPDGSIEAFCVIIRGQVFCA